MKALASLSATALLTLLIAGCGQQQPPDAHAAAAKAIQDTDASFNTDFASKDADKVASYYVDDAVMMVTGSPAVHGKEAIRAAYKQAFSDTGFMLTFHPDKVDAASSGDVGYTQGSFQLAYTNPATKALEHEQGSYVTVYRKMADGSWKAVEDIASTGAPLAPPPAPAAKTAGKH
jgi:uncharacterized protein (TIGR02246 family)